MNGTCKEEGRKGEDIGDERSIYSTYEVHRGMSEKRSIGRRMKRESGTNYREKHFGYMCQYLRVHMYHLIVQIEGHAQPEQDRSPSDVTGT